jgi:hypothetical protein
MKTNWRRGLLRVWVVLSLAWIGVTGWSEYFSAPWNMDWGTPSVRTEGECWDRIAKWPDGQHFSGWEGIAEELDDPRNIEINKKERAWSAESIPARNQWRRTIVQKLAECEAAAPIVQRMSETATRVWQTLKGSLHVILLPPVALLITGWIVGWIMRGFRASA